jgi:RNA polymerase sigma factor (TIGR02999 family)
VTEAAATVGIQSPSILPEDAVAADSLGSPRTPPTEVTALIAQVREGNRPAADELFSLVYADLRRLAKAQLGAHGRPGPTLDTTALVHETYLRLAGPAGFSAADRAHFFNLAARVMRHVIVDFARRRDAESRGSGGVRLDLGEAKWAGDEDERLSADILAVDAALAELERASPELARLVELRFFAGLLLGEIAELVGRSERSLKRDWRRARAFLAARLAASSRESER